MEQEELKTNVQQETVEMELVEDQYEVLDEELDVDMLLPTMNVTNELPAPEPTECFVKDETLVDLYDEILNNHREDRTKADELLTNFLEMVLNEGDATTATKEAIVALVKIKSDSADKMSKIADLMTRVKLKEKDTFPRYLSAQQNNKVVIESGSSKRDLLKHISKMTKKGKPNDSQA